MNDYLNSTHKQHAMEKEKYYGITVWNTFAKYVLENQDVYLDLRYSRAFKEHKNIMLNRLQVLHDEGYMQCQSLVTDYQTEIVSQANLIHSLCIKYNLSHNEDIKRRMYDIINRINSTEKVC